MTGLYPNLPGWCRPGAPVIVTSQASEASAVDPEGRGLWRAGVVESVTDKGVVARTTSPQPGLMAFQANGPGHRPYRISGTLGALLHQLGLRRPVVYLAPADADDVVVQRLNRDRAKYGPGRREWLLTPEGWVSGPLRRVPEEEEG